jgi:hypothetical protein
MGLYVVIQDESLPHLNVCGKERTVEEERARRNEHGKHSLVLSLL